MEKKFFESDSFSLVVGMFEKYGSTEEVAVNFCNSLIDCKSSDDDVCKIIMQYNEREGVDARAMYPAIAYLSNFEEDCWLFHVVLIRFVDADDCIWGWMNIFDWYKENNNSFRCFVDVVSVEPEEIEKGIGMLLKWGELYLEQDKEYGCLRICPNLNKPVDTSRAFEIYNSLMYKPDFLDYAYDNIITMEEASRVIGAEIVKGNMDLIGAL